MNPFRLTPAAADDLFGIWAYIAKQNLSAADRLEFGLLEACQQVADRPDLGHWRHDLTNKPVRFFTVRGTYLIAFDPASVPLEVVRIFHGAQDVATDLDG